MTDLEAELTRLIIETLGLEDLRASDMDPESFLFDGDWGLDSVDALELGLMLQNRYGIRIEDDKAQNRAHFESVRTLAAFVAARRTT